VFALTAEERLPLLGTALASGTYRPDPFRLLAYPKGGGALRHYAVPSTVDQVAFTVFAVLLAPLIDMALARFAFGNRWHRALYRHRDSSGARWRHRPYALDATHLYQPYRRDFSLFRRAAHWSASVMVGRDPTEEESSDKPFKREDFIDDELPECCKASWWTGASGRGYWGRLDLRLAYPSVRISVLGARLAKLLADLPNEKVISALGGYPVHISTSLARPEVRVQLGSWLAEALGHVRYDTASIGDLWIPPHVSHDVPRAGSDDHPGIPTGLALSGVLLNCYLHEFDQRIDTWLRKRQPGHRAALLRFADDIIVLGQQPSTIAEAVDAIWEALEGGLDRHDIVLAAPRRDPSSTNLRVNWDKIEPEGLSNVVRKYLQDFGWREDDTGMVEPEEPAPEVLTFAEWLRRQGDETWLDEFQISRDRIGPFVTHLVERMSALGGESLDDRFGRGATTRLDELHQLLRLDIDDPHVRDDTRLAFAANKIVRAFLPNEGGPSDHAEVIAIRNSIAEAVLRAPWKFSLWRSIVHAACRRPLIRDRADAQLDDEDAHASQWLVRILRRIATSDQDPDSWLRRWPEKSVPERAVRVLYLSFLRAEFWLAIASSIRDLRRVGRGEEAETPRHWSSSSWTFRAVDEKRAPRVLTWLSQLDRWAAVLYDDESPVVYWWERDALATAALTLVDAGLAPSASALSVPDGALEQPRVMGILRAAGRVVSSRVADGSAERWAHVALSSRPHRRAKIIDIAKDLLATVGASHALRWAAALGLVNFLEREAAGQIDKLLRGVRSNPTLPKLEEYQRARRVDLAFHSSTPTERRWTIHRLLWSIRTEAGPPTLWPAAAPAVGVPPRVALRMLVEAISTELADHPPSMATPVWTLPAGAALWEARSRQLSSGAWEPVSVMPRLVTLGKKWDVRPHGAYFLPAAVVGEAIAPLVTRVWSHILQFLTAAQGDESFLDRILAAWPMPVPLEERWGLRADVPIAVPIWRAIDKAIAGALANDPQRVRAAAHEIVRAASPFVDDVVRDFNWDRVDIKLALDGGELPVGCVPFHMRPPPPSGDLALPSTIAKDITVTLAQVSAEPDWLAYHKAYFAAAPPPIPRRARQEIMAQFAAAFASRTAPSTRPDGPILFPEVALPLEEERAFRAHVLARRRAALAGLHWNVVRFAARGNANARPLPPTRFLVNEALLVVPVSHPTDPSVLHPRAFRIRKPLPTHVEHSLTETLSDPPHPALGSKWRMLPGNRWYRFVHPEWGDFTVAICSDLIDPSPWKSLQGQILHLFLLSYNPDVQLYESLTWLRAYEAYTNVLATNHGKPGGSFAWTPASGDSKEVARLRGGDLFLVADIRLEVADLANRQRTGVADAIQDGKATWTGAPRAKRRWKAPPPGYRGR